MTAATLTGHLWTALAILVGAVLLSGATALLATGIRRLAWGISWLYRAATRVQLSALAMLKALDILACTIWLGPLYIIGLADKPTGRRMISSYVGMAVSYRRRWAYVAAAVIDWCAERFGDRPGHCHRAWLHYRGLDL